MKYLMIFDTGMNKNTTRSASACVGALLGQLKPGSGLANHHSVEHGVENRQAQLLQICIW
jgi:hypothetical protein